MKQVIRGYKQGRNIKFYDLEDLVSHEVISRVSKDELESAFAEKPDEYSCLKWQEWKGKKILRITNDYKVIIEETDESGNVKQSEKQIVRATKAINLKEHESALPKTRVVGKLGSKSGYSKKNTAKQDIELAVKESGYSMNNVYEQRALRSSIDLSKFKTVGDLFNQMAKEFGLIDIEKYRNMIEQSKTGVKLSTEISRVSPNQLNSLQNFFAVFMMNMANKQINEAYSKYKLEIMSVS